MKKLLTSGSFLAAMAGVVLALLLGFLIEAAFGAETPKVVSDAPGPDPCAKDHGSCPTRLITVANPLTQAVRVWLTCGPGLLVRAEGVVYAGRRAVFAVATDGPPLRAGACRIAGWEFRR